MKQIKLVAAIFSMLVMCSAAAHAQTPAGKTPTPTQKMEEAMDRLKDSMSKGGSEGVASAGDGVFMNLADFSRASGDDTSAVRSDSPAQFKRKAGLVKVACWEVCVKFGPLNVCYAWETKCK